MGSLYRVHLPLLSPFTVLPIFKLAITNTRFCVVEKFCVGVREENLSRGCEEVQILLVGMKIYINRRDTPGDKIWNISTFKNKKQNEITLLVHTHFARYQEWKSFFYFFVTKYYNTNWRRCKANYCTVHICLWDFKIVRFGSGERTTLKFMSIQACICILAT